MAPEVDAGTSITAEWRTPFSFVPLPVERSLDKPRRRGLTMMIDDGMPLGTQHDVLSVGSRYIDLAKFKTGTARLYEESYLTRKLAAYAEHGVTPFIGGQFHEYMIATQGVNALPRFYDEALRLGFRAIEISDNIVPLTASQRRAHIQAACAAGFEVFGEVGAKDRRSTVEEIVEQAGVCFEAGAVLVLVEAAELVTDGQPNREMIEQLGTALDMAKVMIELPGPWISGVRTCDIESLKKLLIEAYGPDVNLANVAPSTIIDTEASRTGLGASGPLPNRNNSKTKVV